MRYIRVFAVCLASVTLSFAAPSKIAKDLAEADPKAMVDVIVQFTTVPTDRHHQKISKHGGKHKAGLELVKAGLYSVPAHALVALEADPEVVYVSPNRRFRVCWTRLPQLRGPTSPDRWCSRIRDYTAKEPDYA